MTPVNNSCPAQYVLRLKGNAFIQADHHRGPLLPQSLYRSDGTVITNLVRYWARGQQEPWFLATSLDNPQLAVRMYQRRMQPEQYFKNR